LPDVLGTNVGQLVAAEFADPARLTTLGPARFVRFAGARGLRVQRPLAERLVQAARDALPTPDAAIARQVLAADLTLLGELEREIAAAEQQLAILLPDSPFRTVTTVPGWGVVRAANYAGAMGDPTAGPARPRSTALPGCPRPGTNRPGNAATEPSAGKAACTCAAR